MINGWAISAIAIIIPVLNTTEPTALPIAASGELLTVIKDTTISGRVVATLTIVAPTITFGGYTINYDKGDYNEHI